MKNIRAYEGRNKLEIEDIIKRRTYSLWNQGECCAPNVKTRWRTQKMHTHFAGKSHGKRPLGWRRRWAGGIKLDP